jgi:hypothetical protein
MLLFGENLVACSGEFLVQCDAQRVGLVAVPYESMPASYHSKSLELKSSKGLSITITLPAVAQRLLLDYQGTKGGVKKSSPLFSSELAALYIVDQSPASIVRPTKVRTLGIPSGLSNLDYKPPRPDVEFSLSVGLTNLVGKLCRPVAKVGS